MILVGVSCVQPKRPREANAPLLQDALTGSSLGPRKARRYFSSPVLYCPGETSLMPPTARNETGPQEPFCFFLFIQFNSTNVLNAPCVPGNVLETEGIKLNKSQALPSRSSV